MVLQHNIEAWNANRNLNVVTKRQEKAQKNFQLDTRSTVPQMMLQD